MIRGVGCAVDRSTCLLLRDCQLSILPFCMSISYLDDGRGDDLSLNAMLTRYMRARIDVPRPASNLTIVDTASQTASAPWSWSILRRSGVVACHNVKQRTSNCMECQNRSRNDTSKQTHLGNRGSGLGLDLYDYTSAASRRQPRRRALVWVWNRGQHSFMGQKKEEHAL